MTQKERAQAEVSHAKHMRDLKKRMKQSKQDEVIRERNEKEHSEKYRNPLSSSYAGVSVDETMRNY